LDLLPAAEPTNHPYYATEEARMVNGNPSSSSQSLSAFSASSLLGPSDRGIS